MTAHHLIFKNDAGTPLAGKPLCSFLNCMAGSELLDHRITCGHLSRDAARESKRRLKLARPNWEISVVKGECPSLGV